MHELKNDQVWIRLSDDRLDTDAVSSFLRDERAGAIGLFLGTTRRWTNGAETIELEYEAYVPMVLEEMHRIAEEAKQKWPITKLAAHHRTGRVAVMDSSVLVGASSPHRAEAFEACRYLIDELKIRLPIWKRERYAGGDQEWVMGSGSARSGPGTGTYEEVHQNRR